MELLDTYLNAQEQIYKYFGYVEDWKVIPIDDARNCHWFLAQRDNGTGYVIYSDAPLTLESVQQGNVYVGTIYTQRFLPKWVYRGPEYTMISVDTRVDDNKLLMIFSNVLESKDEALREACEEIAEDFNGT